MRKASPAMLIAGLTLFQISCGSAVPKPAIPNILSITTGEMTEICSTQLTKTLATVRIKIDNQATIGNIARHVEYFEGSSADLDGKDDKARDLMGDGKNPLHIDLAKFSPSIIQQNGWVLVRVILLGGDLHFFKPPGTKIEGVGLGSNASDSNFCYQTRGHSDSSLSNTAGKPAEVASFMFKVPFDGDHNQGFNLILMPDIATDTPIIVDPKIQNNG